MLENQDTPLDVAIAAHQAARARRMQMDADDVPDGPEYDAASDAEDKAMLAVIHCRTAEGKMRKLAYVYENDFAVAGGEPEDSLGIGDPFAPTVLAVRAILEHLAA